MSIDLVRAPQDSHLVIENSALRPALADMRVQGSKNCFNHLAAVALLGDRDYELHMANAPDISDRRTVGSIFESVGLSVKQSDGTFSASGQVRNGRLEVQNTQRLRVSICYGAAIAAVHGSCWIPFPGGDAFTHRPIDLHMAVLQAAGARIVARSTGLWVEFPRRPHGFDLDIAGPFGSSMGASVTALVVAAVARGTSFIKSISPEPEVHQVKLALQRLGVRIDDLGPEGCRVDGADGSLRGTLARTVPGDRMEAATYIFMAAARKVPLRLHGLRLADLPIGLRGVLGEVGIDCHGEPDRGAVQVGASPLEAVNVQTAPHPGFPTDAQPQLAAMLAFADGTSTVTESIYSARTTHITELRKLNIRIGIDGQRQTIPGRQTARAGSAQVHDIRCGAALLVAAATASGKTVLSDRSRHLQRGYSELESKLGALGMSASWIA